MNKAHRALALTILSLSVVSLIIITISEPNYSSAQASENQNATTLGGAPSISSIGMNTTDSPRTISQVRTFVEQARMTLQNNDIQGALMNVDSALAALEGVEGDGEQSDNMTATNIQNEVTDQTTTTEAGTIGSGGAGGAGTAGGIMTGSGT